MATKQVVNNSTCSDLFATQSIVGVGGNRKVGFILVKINFVVFLFMYIHS